MAGIGLQARPSDDLAPVHARLDHLTKVALAPNELIRGLDGKVTGSRKNVPAMPEEGSLSTDNPDIGPIVTKLNHLLRIMSAPTELTRTAEGKVAATRYSKYVEASSSLDNAMVQYAHLSRSATAHHEAGHGVAGIVLGFPPRWMKLGKVEHVDAAGETKFPRMINVFEPEANTAEAINAFCVIKLAGYVSTVKFLRAIGAPVDFDSVAYGAGSDFKKVDLVFEEFKIPDADTLLATIISDTERLIAANWRRVETVATALLRFGALSGLQVRAAFDKGGR